MSEVETNLALDHSQENGVLVIKVKGRLDSHGSPTAQAAFVEAVQKHPKVLVDCSQTTLLSSCGLRAIIIAHRTARERGSKFAVWIDTPAVMETVQVSAIDKVVPIMTTRLDALARLD